MLMTWDAMTISDSALPDSMLEMVNGMFAPPRSLLVDHQSFTVRRTAPTGCDPDASIGVV
jgi:hypothetical protein